MDSVAYVQLMLQHRRVALTQTVHVEDSHQVIQLIVRREHERLPHAALGRLSVAHQAIHTIAAHRRTHTYALLCEPVI